MPFSNTDQENGFLKLLNVPLKQFQPLVKQCSEVKFAWPKFPCTVKTRKKNYNEFYL